MLNRGMNRRTGFSTRILKSRNEAYFLCLRWNCEPEQLSQYSVWLRAGRPGDRGSIPGGGERIFPIASVFRPALGPTQHPVEWVPGVLSREQSAAGA
jgi:hypothetical protein